MSHDWERCEECNERFLAWYQVKARDILHYDGPEAVREYLDEVLGEWHDAGHSDE